MMPSLDHAQDHYRQFDCLRRPLQCPTVSTALHLQLVGRLRFVFQVVPRLVHLLKSSYRTCTPHSGASPIHKQDVGHLRTARDVLYAGEPAVRPAATLTRILPRHFQLDGYVKGHQTSFWTHVVMSCSRAHRDMERSRSGLPDVQPRRNWPGHNGRPSGAAAHDAPGECLVSQ